MSADQQSIGRQRGKRTAVLEDWLLAEQRHHLQRLLAPATTAVLPSGSRRPTDDAPKTSVAKMPRAKWLLMPGICAVSFGAVLLAWGWCAGRIELGQVGLPATVIGQVLLWIGFRARPAATGVQGETCGLVAADLPPLSAVWQAPLPVVPPLPSLQAVLASRARNV